MSKGITRARDRVALWHEAADEEGVPAAEWVKQPLPEKPSTSEPPVGGAPEPVAVSKSKKFITPANQLKKTLEPLPAPTESTGALEGHPDLQAFTQKHPAFAKSYFKPDYQDMLKAHLGDQNYHKLLTHLPYEHFKALNTHAQAPAPNTNKFTQPANALKKLLDDPHTETSHVQQWLQTPQGASFAKGYLSKPTYQDAIKGHLGEKGYEELQTHLNAPEKAQEKAEQPSGLTHDLLWKHFPNLQESQSNSDEWVKGGQQKILDHLKKFEPGGPWAGQNLPVKKKWQDLYQEAYGHHPDEHLGQPQAEKPQPELSHYDQVVNALGPEKYHTPEFQKWFYGHDKSSQANLAQMPEQAAQWFHEDQQKKQDQGSPNYQKLMQAVSPTSEAGKAMHSPAFKDWFHDQGYGEGKMPPPVKLHNDFKKSQGQGGVLPHDEGETPQQHPLQSQMLQFAHDNGWDAQDIAMVESPAFTQWAHQQPSHVQQNGILSPTKTFLQFAADQQGEPQGSDADEAAKIQQHIQEAEPLQEWEQELLQSAGQPPQQPEPSAGHIANEIEKIFPNANMDNLSTPELKAQLEQWLKYLPEHEGYASHVPQLQALYDQHFGGGQSQETKPGTGHPFFDAYDDPNWQSEQQPELSKSPEDQAFQAWFGQTNGLTEEQAKKEFAKMGPQGIALWSPGGAYYKQYGPGAPPQSGEDQPNAQSLEKDLHEAFGGTAAASWLANPSKIPDYLNGVALGGGENGAKAKALQQKYQDYFGQGQSDDDHIQAIQDLLQSVHSPQQSLKDKLNTIYPNWTKGDWLESKSPEEQKELFGPWLSGHQLTDEQKQKFHQVYNEYFGEPHPLAQPEHTFNPSESYEDPATGDWQHNEASLPPGLKAYAEEEGVPLTSYAGWELQNLLDKGWSQLTPAQKQSYAAQEQGQQQPHDPYAYPGASFAGENQGFWGDLPSGFIDWDEHKASGTAKPLPGIAAFLESKGYGPDELKALPYSSIGDKPSQVSLMQDWQALPQQAKDQFASQEQPDQQAQQQPKGITTDKLLQYFPALKDAPSSQDKWLAGGDPAKQQQLLQQQIKFTEGNPTVQQQWQALYDDAFGGAQQSPPAGGGPAPFDAHAIAKGMQAADPHTFDNDWVANSQNDYDGPEDWKHHLQSLATGNFPPEEKAQYQALLDKYFPEGGQQQSHPPVKAQDIVDHLISKGWTQDSSGVEKLQSIGNDSQQLKEQLEFWAESGSSPSIKQTAQVALDKFFGSGTGGATQQAPAQQQFDTSKNPGAEYLESLGVKPSSANSIGSQSSQLFWNNFNAVKKEMDKGEGHKMPEQWQTVVKGMMAQGGPQQPAKPEFDWDTFGPEFKALYPNSSWANDVQSEQAAQQKLQNAVANANENFPGTDKTKAVNQLYQKWFGGGGEQAHDPDQMSADWENVIGNAHQWDFSDPEKVAKFKKQLASQLKGSGYWDPWSPEKMKAGQAFYDKYFGGGGNADLNAIQQQMQEVEPEEPAKPFKSEELNADDFNQWAAHKPQDAAQWKDFASWWGNTKMPPEAEQELYNTWFGKQASPEQAQQWFQAVFEHNSQPSEGDLGSNYTPSWAHNSWAFGDKAEQEWPLFQTWAIQHPGIPKNTSIKQKLAIWNGLSDQDKSQLADEYLPQNQIDTKAVVKALKAAYPDSDWSKWAKLPQSALKQSVESLAHSGYGGAIPVFNQFFGGDVPMPEEAPEEEPTEQAQPTEPELPPPEALPQWVQQQMAGKNPGVTKKLTKEFVGLANFAKSVGQSDAVMGDTKPTELGQIWNKIPGHLKAQIAGMTEFPWHDMAGFEAWRDAQPGVADAIKAVAPDVPLSYHPFDEAYKNHGTYDKYKASALGKIIDQEKDPQTKQALLGVYHQFFGHDKTTLAESLKGIDPDTDWDKTLQSKSKTQVASLVKKQLKTEQDPVKWAQLANVWLKHFPHPDYNSKPMPTGIKALTDFFKYTTPGKGLDAQALTKLKAYKALYPNNESDYVGWQSETDPAMQELAAQDEGKSFMPYHGWTPPSGTSMAKFTADPASYAKSPSGGTTYAVPEAAAKGKEYQGLLDRADQMASGFFSAKDKAALKSDTFANWFNKAPLAYRQQRQDNPGVALDDFDDFMSGGAPYPGVSGAPAGKEKFIDVSPFGAVPQQGQGKPLPKSQTHNPSRVDFVKFPRQEDPQETLPLGPGERFAPGYAPLPIYRLVNLSLDKKIDPDHAPAQYKTPQQKGLWAQQQQSRLRRIDEILNGSNAQRDPKKDFQRLQQWGQSYGLTDKEVSEVAGILLGKQPDLFTDEKWHSIEDFGKAQKAKGKEIDLSDLHDLARDLEVTPPPNARGNYDHPELGQLILDYMENTSHRYDDEDDDAEARGSQGGLGWHWTRSINKVYKGIPAADQGVHATPRNVPVAISGLWSGQGEGAGHGGAFNPSDKSETEHNLHSHAPVHIRRLQIRAPGHGGGPEGGWHDTIDHGPISLWGPGRYEEGDEKHGIPGKQVGYKPSLAEELDKIVPGVHNPKDFDTMVPGHRADNTFAQLIHDHPKQRERLLTLYRDFFVGRPDLPTKPHTRRASVTPPVRIARLDERNPAHLFDLARNWGIVNPERYGIPLTQAKEFLTDLKGVGWATKEVVKEHGLGIPNPRRGQPTVAAIEDQIMRLAATVDELPEHMQKPHWLGGYGSYGHVPGEFQDHYQNFIHDMPDEEAAKYSDPEVYGNQGKSENYRDDFEEAWEDYLAENGVKPNWEYGEEDNDDDYHGQNLGDEDDDDFGDDEYDDEDFSDPPLPAGDRPEGWPNRAPFIKRDPRNRQYFPAHGLNPPSSSPSRPDIDWQPDYMPHDPHLPGQDWPQDRNPQDMYRGLTLHLNQDQSGKDPLGPLRRSLYGPQYELGPQEGTGGKTSPQSGDKALAQAHPLGFDNPALGEHILNHVQNNPKAYEGHEGYGVGPHWSENLSTARSFANQDTMANPLKLPVVMRAQWKGLGEDPYRTHTQGDWPEEGEVTMLPGANMDVDSVQIQHPHTKKWHEVLSQPMQRPASVRKPRGILSYQDMRA